VEAEAVGLVGHEEVGVAGRGGGGRFRIVVEW
jgi:hypothetical protein